MTKRIQLILAISRRELQIFSQRPLYLYTMIIAPILCLFFFTTLMDKGLPTKLPAALVDKDNTHVTHIVARIIGSMEETKIVAKYQNFSDARSAMQKGEIYGFFYIPKKLTEKALANRQPRVSFYTNDAYFVPGTLLMKDLRYASELSGLALTRQTLYAKGFNERQAMGIIQPIVIETHPLNNSFLNYSVYLNNILLPGILILLIMLSAAYTIGLEWKLDRQRKLFSMSGGSSSIAITGKLLPQTFLFTFIFVFYDVYLYKILLFPCNCGLLPMMMLGFLTVLASQSFAIFLFGAFIGRMRLSMCLCALWGILSFSLTGFTYPVTAMDPVLQKLAWLFPLRHYYLIYVNQALDGFSIFYVWRSVVALLLFLALPLFVLPRYRSAFLKYKYKP